MKYIFLLLSILMSCVLVQNDSFANGGPLERVNPVSELSPELQKIIDHHYDYPYSKKYTYPDQIYDYRKKIENDIYSKYIGIQRPEQVYRTAEFYNEDQQMYEMALKIGLCQKITDADFIAIRDRINQRYSGRVLLELAVSQRNLEAIDLLFKYGADPFMSYAGDYKDSKPAHVNFVYQMRETFNPGFSSDAIKLFVKHRLDPNHLMNLKGNGTTFKEDGTTFLGGMVLVNNELSWIALMEGGGNPWAKYTTAGLQFTIVSDAASRDYFPFLDYIIAKGYLRSASKEDIEGVVKAIMEWPLEADNLNATNRQRILRSIIKQSDIIPSQKNA